MPVWLRLCFRLGGSGVGHRTETVGPVAEPLVSVAVDQAVITPGQLLVDPQVVQAQVGVFDDVKIGRVVEVPGGEQPGVALEEAHAAVVAAVNERQHREVHRAERLRQQTGADRVGGLAGIVLEQAGAPAPRQDAPGEQETGQVQQLTQVVVGAQVADGMGDDPVGIPGRQPFRPADAQMIASVVAQRGDDGSLAQQRLEQQLLVRIAAIEEAHPVLQVRVVDIVQTTDVEGGMGPGALGDDLDHLAHPAAAFHQHHVTWTHLVTEPVEITQRRIRGRSILGQPVGDPAADTLRGVAHGVNPIK